MRKVLVFLFLSSLALAQNVRYDAPFPSVSATYSPLIQANIPPNSPILAVCHSPANAVPCTNYATTYTFAGVACSNGAQDTPQPSRTSACQSTGDAQGNIGFWAPTGTYDYTVCIANTTSCFGPYTVTIGGGGGIVPISAQLGDTLRYNVNGDTTWDAVNHAQAMMGVYAINQTSNALAVIGPFNTAALTPTGSGTTVNATATLQPGLTLSSSSSASTSTVIGFWVPQNGSVSLLGMLAFYRLSTRMSIANTTNARYWLGLGCWNSSGIGNNTLNVVGSTAYAADSPNKTTIGFRFSSTTDTHWQAVSVVAGGSQTVLDTGVTPDTNPHLFEIVPNATGTAMTYFIDTVNVGTISTNIPLASAGGNSLGSLFFTGDNKNTANAVAATFYSMQISLKF